MRAGRLAHAHLQRGDAVHECHVRCGGRHEGAAPYGYGGLYQRVVLIDGRGMHAGAALLGVGFEQLVDEACGLLIGVGVGGAYVDDKAALVGDDVVLRAGIDLCDGHLDVAKQLGAALEAEVAQALDVSDGYVDGIHALVACGMSAYAMGYAVHHHQSALSHGSLHACGLTHKRHVDLAQLGQQGAHAMLAHHLLLGADGKDDVVG